MPKYSVDIVAKWDGEIVAEGEDEAVEQAIDLFQKEYIITDLNLDAPNEEERKARVLTEPWPDGEPTANCAICNVQYDSSETWGHSLSWGLCVDCYEEQVKEGKIGPEEAG